MIFSDCAAKEQRGGKRVGVFVRFVRVLGVGRDES